MLASLKGLAMFAMIDVGGTRTRVGCANGYDALNSVDIFQTGRDYSKGLGTLVGAVKRIGGERLRRVAVGVPGILTRDKRRIVNAQNLPNWNGAALADDLEAALGAPVILENDTALVGLGEANVGAGKGAAIVAYM